MKTRVENRLAQVRKTRGVGASDLARRVHVSRQTIYAIEAGTYVPNTEVALNLARELEVTVGELFSLQPGSQKSPESLAAEVLSAAAPAKGQPSESARSDRAGSAYRSARRPTTCRKPTALSSERVKRTAVLTWWCSRKKTHRTSDWSWPVAIRPRVFFPEWWRRLSGVEIVSAAASSKLALAWLNEGKVHIAGSHLEDPKTGEFNLPFIRKEFPDEDFRVVTFASWEEGLVIAPGNPKGVHKVEDLARKNVRFVNREPGSGSRALLDKLLAKAGMNARTVKGYDRVAHGHLAAAYCVLSEDADVCLATRSAAQTFGLDFIPLQSERYDLVMRKRTADLPAVKAFLDVLQRATLRRKLEVLAGYDTSKTGALIA